MTYFVLDNLCCPVDEGPDASLGFGSLPFDFDGMIAFALARIASRDRQPSSVSYGPDFLIISGLNIIIYVPSLSNTIIRLRTPIIFAAIPTQASL